MNRRTFIQGLIGLATMPALGKYINIFKPAAVREGITQAADNTMSKGIEFYEAIIKRVMDEGTIVNESDRIRTYKHPDKPDIDVEINLGTGDTSVNFESDYGYRAGAEITTDIEAGPGSKELMEGELVYRGQGPEGDYTKDWEEGIIEGGITNLEDWIKRKRGYAAGGRVGLLKGGMPRGLMAALKTIRGKFGKGAIHQGDEVVVDGKTYKYNDPNRPATEFEIETKYEELMDPQEGLPGYTVKELDQALIDAKDYETAMFREYKAGRLDPPAGSKTRARLNLLRQREEEARLTNDYRLFKQDEAAELEYLEDYFRKDYLDFKAQEVERPMSDSEIAELKELSEKGFKDGGDVSLTVIKIPDISGSGVETLFERR
jgi:hypothetical protein